MTDLSLLGGDPAPGSAWEIRALGTSIGQVGSAAFDAYVELDRVGSDIVGCGWTGEAAVGFDAAFSDLPSGLRSMAQSYEEVACALKTYADKLEDLKVRVDHALAKARVAAQAKAKACATKEAARQKVASLQRQVGQLRRDEAMKTTALAGAPPDDACRPTLEWETDEARRLRTLADQRLGDASKSEACAGTEIADAENDLAAARRAADAIRDERSSAERACEAAIRTALARDLKNKSNLEKVQALPGEVWDAIKDFDWDGFIADLREVLGTLSSVLGVVALVLAATGIGGPIAVLVGLAAAACAVAKLACTATLMARGAVGADGKPITWGDLAMDGFMAATSFIGPLGAVKSIKSIGGLGGLKHLRGVGSQSRQLFNAGRAGGFGGAGRTIQRIPNNMLKQFGVDRSLKRALYPMGHVGRTSMLGSTSIAPVAFGKIFNPTTELGTVALHTGIASGKSFLMGSKVTNVVTSGIDVLRPPHNQPPRIDACYADAS